jgi:transposase
MGRAGGYPEGMSGYSIDLRERIVAAVATGAPQTEVAERFGVSVTTVRRYRRLVEQTGTVQAGARRARSRLVGDEAGLRAQLEARPDATLAEHCDAWAATHGARPSEATMCRAITRLRWTRKKRR